MQSINEPIFSAADIFVGSPLEDETSAQTVEGGMSTPDAGYAVPMVTEDVTETRYLINPFMICNLTNLANPLGYSFLPHGQFIKIAAVTEEKAQPNYTSDQPVSPYGKPQLMRNTRQPGHILNDLIAMYSGVGVTEITALRGADNDKFVFTLSKSLLGEIVPSRSDIYNEDIPCPVLPAWAEQIEANYHNLRLSYTDKPEIALQITSIYRDIQKAFGTAREYATALTQAAQGRISSPGAGNRFFDSLERRGFIALGRDIPDQLPTVSGSDNKRSELVENALINLAQERLPQPAPGVSAEVASVLQQNEHLRSEIAEMKKNQDEFMARFQTIETVAAEAEEVIEESSAPARKRSSAAAKAV